MKNEQAKQIRQEKPEINLLEAPFEVIDKWQGLIDAADVVIAENIKEITKEYYESKNRAGYGWRNAGLNRTYEALNQLLPSDFREKLDFQEAMLVNTAIKGLLTRRNELH